SPSASSASSRTAPPAEGPPCLVLWSATAPERIRQRLQRSALPTVSPGRRASSLRPATRRRYRSAARFSSNTHPRKPTVNRLERANPNRLVRSSCRNPKKSRRGKALSFLTRQRPTRLRCRHGLTRTEAPIAASTVARLPTSRLVQQRLNQRG